ncbi:MAG TPA: proteasome subunit alpha [Acidimicrobiia bacterium]
MTIPFYVPPEQFVKDKAEFARKGIARGRSIAALACSDGIVIVAENPSGTLHKISEIYDRVAFAGVGRYHEFEALRVAGVRHADLKGYLYGRADVTGKGLASAFSQTLGNIFIHELKPYEVEILVVEVGSTIQQDSLFRVTYDGTLYAEDRFVAIGGQAEGLVNALEGSYAEPPPWQQGLKMGVEAFRQAGATNGEGWEAAILYREATRRAFQRFEADEISSALA